MRERKAGYITGQKDEGFGLEVKVNRQPFPKSDFSPSGDVSEVGPGRNLAYKGYREVIPPGAIGSNETDDVELPAAQHVDTVARYGTEEKDPTLHGAVKVVREEVDPPMFHDYASFQPRTAPMPRAAQDNLYLRGYGMNVADPRMSDEDSTKLILNNEHPDRLDLYGQNRDGVLHNENGHPGFKAVEAKIGKESGIRNPGAVLAAASRNASPAAKKANPNLKKVRG